MKSSFTISEHLDKNKVFIVNSSEIDNRLDPSWCVYLNSVKNFKYEKVLLKNLLLKNPQYGANEIGVDRKSYDDPRYIRITDINEFGELNRDIGKTADKIEEKYFLEDGDLLLARSGNTVGKSYLHTDTGYKCFFAGYMIRFKIDTSKTLPDYVFVFTQTRIYKNWVAAIQRTTGQPNINAEEYRNLAIPLPSFEIQRKLISIYYEALKQKQENESEAEKLLASIDDYFLDELGIKLPTQPENSLKNRTFYTSLKEISGGRFDPFFYQNKFTNNIGEIKKSKYPVMPLKHIINNNLVKGILPRHEEKEGSNKVVQINSINVDGTINLDDLLTAKDIFSNNHLLRNNDVLVVITGATIGKVAYWIERDENYFLGGDIVKFQTIEPVDSAYIYYFLRSYPIQTQIKRDITGATNGHLSPEDIKHLPIPLPPLPKQQEIANHITQIRNQAQLLKEQANIAIKQANQEIEQILIGS